MRIFVVHKRTTMKNIRFILPDMIGISNNSQITNQVANSIISKLTDNEIADFKIWLRLIENKIQSEKNNSKRFF